MADIPQKDIDKVLKALDNRQFKWRTVRGISKETKLPQEVIQGVLKVKEGDIVQSSVPSTTGEDLFTLRQTFSANTPFVGQLLGALKGRAR